MGTDGQLDCTTLRAGSRQLIRNLEYRGSAVYTAPENVFEKKTEMIVAECALSR